MEIRNLVTFMHVAEQNSFTQAAKILGYTQSTVSLQIRQLERELGCELFDRIYHSIVLTDKGEELLRYAHKIARLTDELKESFARTETPTGHVHIVTSDSICEDMMTSNYYDFYQHYPRISLEFHTANTDEMLEVLYRNKADIIFTLDNHIYQNDLIIAKEEPVRLHFVTAAGSPLTGKTLRIEELMNEPFLLTEKGMSYRKILNEELAKRSMEISPVIEIGRTDIITDCLEQGVGVSFLPEFVTEKLVQQGKLAYLDVEGFQLKVWKQLIYHRNKWVSRALESFIEYVKEKEFTSASDDAPAY